MRSDWPIRVATWLGALLAGAVFGIAGTVMHSAAVIPLGVGGVVLPVGMLIAAVGSLALLVAVRILGDDRATVLATGLGMLAALLAFSGQGPGGSVVVPAAAEGQPPLGIIWSWTVAIVVLLVVAWPDLRGVRSTSGERTAPDA
ncbi:hypothetical protein [Microbacterium sediminis]|uniref:Uncharacterized protein n=1 Tax=Microbacterium sediminis TaxID=904291 RepID=A0A1B9NG19_9MICO|nr:hypothetical protein [Microbacterium sediminis]OCG75547.1 hypothetical protein A7J15_00325 [Microbacterium sediminis]QBR73942.1 histidinol dehydrogenase [Microbacterium sediminis]